MNCIEARRMVTPFINKELSDKETEQFLKHVEHCSDCMDELSIYYTVYKALDMLDSGLHHEYDFGKMLEEEMRAARRGILRGRITRVLSGILFVLAELLLICSVFTGFEMKQGETGHSTIQKAIYRLNIRQRSTEAETKSDEKQGEADTQAETGRKSSTEQKAAESRADKTQTEQTAAASDQDQKQKTAEKAGSSDGGETAKKENGKNTAKKAGKQGASEPSQVQGEAAVQD